jgi:hypothetical protein
MNALRFRNSIWLLASLAAGYASSAAAQVPVDSSGEPLATYESMDEGPTEGNEQIPLLTRTELQDLVGPVALYPDDLLAVVLPASTFPLQLVEAQRFLDALEQDPSLSPDEDWDDSIIAILNYPEVVELLNEDLDWTWRLGEAVVAQQADVVAAVESFRDRAYAAGNLQSDSHQTVAHNEGAIEITPVEDDVIYVPYYEPESVVVHQSRPVYYYYPRAYPVYYYPYPDYYAFNRVFNRPFNHGFFWGVTTAYTLGWVSHSVHVLHHSYHGHPYYGRSYWDGWWYRRPSIHVHNNYYTTNSRSVSRHRYSRGDYWRPRYESRRRLNNQRITRSNYYVNHSDQGRSSVRRGTVSNRATRATTAMVQPVQGSRNAAPARHRTYTPTSSRSRHAAPPTTVNRAAPQRVQHSPPTRNSRPDRSQRREVVQPRETQPVRTQQQNLRRHDNSGNSGNERRSDSRREPPAVRQDTSRRAERQSGKRKQQSAPERRGHSRGNEPQRQRK